MLSSGTHMSNVRADISQELFQEIFSAAKALTLPPACCVPYIKIRHVSESGVRRLMQSYRDKYNEDSMFQGATASGNLSTVVPLTGATREYPKNTSKKIWDIPRLKHWPSFQSFSSWYGIVEGCHRTSR